VRYWDSPAQQQLLCLGGHTDYVRCGAVSPVNGEVWATGSYDHTLRLWDVRSGQSVLRLDHGQPLEDVAFFPSGGLLVSAGGNYLNVWDILAGEPHKAVAEWCAHQVALSAYCITTSFPAKQELISDSRCSSDLGIQQCAPPVCGAGSCC
jgi:U3 small nucleolar RNA-associated protein 15